MHFRFMFTLVIAHLPGALPFQSSYGHSRANGRRRRPDRGSLGRPKEEETLRAFGGIIMAFAPAELLDEPLRRVKA
jgi:hypothetical protein